MAVVYVIVVLALVALIAIVMAARVIKQIVPSTEVATARIDQQRT